MVHSRDAWIRQKLEVARKDSSLDFNGNSTLIFLFLASRTVRKYISAILSHQVYCNLLQNPWETVQKYYCPYFTDKKINTYRKVTYPEPSSQNMAELEFELIFLTA